MSNVSHRVWRKLLVLAVVVTVAGARAETNTTNNSGTINCSEGSAQSSCAECCSIGCGLRISCCPLSGPCTVTNKPSPPPLKLKVQAGGLNLQFQRLIKPDYVDVKLKAAFIKGTFPQGINMKVRLTGPDARIAGLLYPVVFLNQGDAAITNLNIGGYNVSLVGAPATCQSLFPAAACTEMAVGLSRSIQGGIGVFGKAEFDAFLTGVNGFGLGPCSIIF